MKKAQFMLITIVLMGVSFFTMFLLVRAVDRSSAILFEPPHAGFENIKNSIIERNNWISDYWFNLYWNNRTIIYVPAPIPAPAKVNPQIPTGINCNNEVRVTNSSGFEIFSNVDSEMSPCNVIFMYPIGDPQEEIIPVGYYYIYWGNPSATPPPYRNMVPDTGNVPPGYTTGFEDSPKAKFCPHAHEFATGLNEFTNCSIQSLIADGKKINYTIYYRTPSFSYTGFLN